MLRNPHRARGRQGGDGRQANLQIVDDGASCEAFSQFFRATNRDRMIETQNEMIRVGFNRVCEFVDDEAGHEDSCVHLLLDGATNDILAPGTRAEKLFAFSTLACPSEGINLPPVTSLASLVELEGEGICLSKTFDVDTTYAAFKSLHFLKEFRFQQLDPSVVAEMARETNSTRYYVEPQRGLAGLRAPPRVVNRGEEKHPSSSHTFVKRIFLGRTRNDNTVSLVQLHRSTIDSPCRRVAYEVFKLYLEKTINGTWIRIIFFFCSPV